jgi:competence protein ComEA
MLMVVIGAAVVGLGGALYLGSGAPPAPLPEAPVAALAPELIVVHVSGAVRDPGLVSLVGPARVADAVHAAGGATSVADLSAINLASSVGDGEQIVVPAVGESGEAGDGLIDLNRATAQDLAQLHGIGPVLADRIVAYREEHGRFESVESLLDVPGIGEAKLALLRPGVSTP